MSWLLRYWVKCWLNHCIAKFLDLDRNQPQNLSPNFHRKALLEISWKTNCLYTCCIITYYLFLELQQTQWISSAQAVQLHSSSKAFPQMTKTVCGSDTFTKNRGKNPHAFILMVVKNTQGSLSWLFFFFVYVNSVGSLYVGSHTKERKIKGPCVVLQWFISFYITDSTRYIKLWKYSMYQNIDISHFVEISIVICGH